ncbi:MAG: hypothetical protein PHI05_03550 [Bacilli bacterium]|nr:hypothetical protein [Bacilli bacterium]
MIKRIENIEKNILSQDVEKTTKVEKPKTEKTKIEKNIDDIKTTKNANLITDDQFFDDFFGDD